MGESHGEKTVNKGDAAARRSSVSSHKQTDLLKREGVNRTIRGVSVDENWRKKAGDAGITESSARNRLVKAAENDRLQELKRKYPGYNFDRNKQDPTVKPTAKQKNLLKAVGKPTTEVKSRSVRLNGEFVSKSNAPKNGLGRGSKIGAAGTVLGLGFMMYGELTGDGSRDRGRIAQMLNRYQQVPRDDSNAATLGAAIGGHFGMTDTATFGLQQALILGGDPDYYQ